MYLTRINCSKNHNTNQEEIMSFKKFHRLMQQQKTEHRSYVQLCRRSLDEIKAVDPGLTWNDWK